MYHAPSFYGYGAENTRKHPTFKPTKPLSIIDMKLVTYSSGYVDVKLVAAQAQKWFDVSVDDRCNLDDFQRQTYKEDDADNRKVYDAIGQRLAHGTVNIVDYRTVNG